MFAFQQSFFAFPSIHYITVLKHFNEAMVNGGMLNGEGINMSKIRKREIRIQTLQLRLSGQGRLQICGGPPHVKGLH